MSNPPVRAATDRDPYGLRAATARILANALLALVALEAVAFVGLAVAKVVGWSGPPGTPLEWVPFAAAFYLIRWLYVLPGLLLVLVGIEYVARRVPYARVLTAIIAIAPMVWWELTQASGDFPSVGGAFLGWIALVFAVLARLPGRLAGSTEERGAPRPLPDLLAPDLLPKPAISAEPAGEEVR
jgi:hypothetical protein